MLKKTKLVSLILLSGALAVPVGAFAEIAPEKQSVSVSQQSGKVSGVVEDALGPITGATVLVKGTTNGNVTDMDGNFTLENVKKGDVLGVARVAGIMGVKRTSELIPMCHPLPIQKCSVDFETDEDAGVIRVFCTVKTEGKTGVEMEALTGVQVALLTIYDMCKAIDKHMVMSDIHLEEKTGGKSGDFRFEEK